MANQKKTHAQNSSLVSVIVPTRNSIRTIEACLRSIREQSYKSIELIVVDNKSTDRTPAISKRHADVFLSAGPERSAQRNAGAAKAKGSFLIFIDSDMVLSEHVVEQVVSQFKSDATVEVVVVPEISFGTTFWARCKQLERSFYVGLHWMEAARCFKTKTFWEFDGYNEDNTGTEDYDLPQRIMFKYGTNSVARVSAEIKHDEGALSLGKTLQKKFYYAQNLHHYAKEKSNHSYLLLQANPLARLSVFLRKPQLVLTKPSLYMGMISMKMLEFMAGFLGWWYGRFKSFTTVKGSL